MLALLNLRAHGLPNSSSSSADKRRI